MPVFLLNNSSLSGLMSQADVIFIPAAEAPPKCVQGFLLSLSSSRIKPMRPHPINADEIFFISEFREVCAYLVISDVSVELLLLIHFVLNNFRIYEFPKDFFHQITFSKRG